MTMPPEPPVVTELRDALAAHDEWPNIKTRGRVVDAARALLQEADAQRAKMEAAITEMQARDTPGQPLRP